VYGIVFISLLLIGLMLFFHYSRKKIVQEQLATIELQLSYQKNVLQATIATQEDERNRIAQDLHDEISSKLNIVSLSTNLLLEDGTLTISQKDAVEHILNITAKTLENARKLAHDLLPPVLGKFGLKVALEEFFDDFIRTNKLQILYKVVDVSFFSKTESLHLFRITQELFSNAINHGKATQIQIDVTANESVFSLIFKDNGVGFIPEVLSEKTGIGLQNIASRVSILHADLSIESVLGKGSTFTIISKNDE
jgi:signal transduction histidine kinase